ncbi:SPFH domain-containing protein [Eisenibacter elegans]|jgi:regulator of protease activity HflC (stomatin/prohibitin superfamily)|uniref:SPFH domain-containing protein n=1 Tax=Eisenibacter elegans TaxID=997 RepID=UPI000411AB2A|nr:SPFH domain-containing protein [Eisenibacter elegans]
MTEKNYTPASAYGMLLLSFLVFVGSIALVFVVKVWAVFGFFLLGFLMPGFFIVDPNSSKVLTLFGEYKGTVKANGFFWANPFYTKKSVSLRARNFDSERLKVNDKLGNPIMISIILVWQVRETFKAAFEVDDYEQFVRVQSDAAVRKLAGAYPYDNLDDEAELTLRSGTNEVNHHLEEELAERLAIAGIQVIEARIGYLAYATEIAGAMLRRQQAAAVVAARQKIVEGAVGMVEMALDQLSKKQVVDLDDERRAAMVSNLMVVLCADKDVAPVVNAGTLHH